MNTNEGYQAFIGKTVFTAYWRNERIEVETGKVAGIEITHLGVKLQTSNWSMSNRKIGLYGDTAEEAVARYAEYQDDQYRMFSAAVAAGDFHLLEEEKDEL